VNLKLLKGFTEPRWAGTLHSCGSKSQK